MNSSQVMALSNAAVDNNLNFTTGSGNLWNTGGTGVTNLNCWGYWRDWYYPTVIRESYPVYVQEKALDKGKQAFEIIKILKDKKLVQLGKVSDFIDLMDELIKIL